MLFEIKIIEWLQSFSCTALDVLTSLSSYFFDYAIIIAVFFLFYFNNKKAYAGYYVLIQGLGAMVQHLAKKVFMRPRPYLASDTVVSILTSEGSAFPSGHSVAAMGVFMFVMFFIYSENRNKNERITFTILGVLYLLFNMFNRMYLGQHYLTDILGGYLLMVAICSISYLAYKTYVKGYNFVMSNCEKRFIKNKTRESKEKKTIN
ncbi:MAG: phosphatase PAP2 family protein, partial [Clostridia bacterium]|nr:phosphatase PAP2 family protein [Clostridia bacterium]